MNLNQARIILPGQLYLNDDLNEYLIVTGSGCGQIKYAGPGFSGHAEIDGFLERFQPVHPDDVSTEELDVLLKLCREGVTASVGIITEEDENCYE